MCKRRSQVHRPSCTFTHMHAYASRTAHTNSSAHKPQQLARCITYAYVSKADGVANDNLQSHAPNLQSFDLQLWQTSSSSFGSRPPSTCGSIFSSALKELAQQPGLQHQICFIAAVAQHQHGISMHTFPHPPQIIHGTSWHRWGRWKLDNVPGRTGTHPM